MKLQPDLSVFLCLVGTLSWKVRFCQAFTPSLGRSPHHAVLSHRAPGTRLHSMLLIVEEFDEDEGENGDVGPDSKTESDKNRDISMGNNDVLQPQIHFIIQGNGDVGGENASSSSLASLIADWKEQLSVTPAPPLTTMGRARLEKEIALLELLEYGDEAASKLSAQWRNARGPAPAQVLDVADSLMKQGHPIAWSQAEAMLLQLIKEQGVHWVAPINSLATLKYLQGRTEESKELYEVVLSQKPWHMGALAGIHDTCKALDDYKGLVTWDRERMPSLQDEKDYPSRRGMRAEWTQRMVEKAKAALRQAEEGLQGYFHDTYNTFGSEGSILTETDHSDAWQ